MNWKTCDQETLLTGAGALEYSSHVRSISSVGEAGTATFDVTDLARDAANNGNGLVSFRFTVNGTAQPFTLLRALRVGLSSQQ